MTDKNRRKLQAKKARNFWTCARPVTQIVPNKRAYKGSSLWMKSVRIFTEERSDAGTNY